jgi:hypothetical protein
MSSLRTRAWRNAMVAAINAGLEQKQLCLEPGTRLRNKRGELETRIYRFSIDGIPAIASATDVAFGEIRICVALWPTAKAEQWIAYNNAGFHAGELFATGCLFEYRTGRRLRRYDHPTIRCRSEHTIVATLELGLASYEHGALEKI